MRSIISQSVVLPAPAESLFAMYTDPAKHAAITGAPVAISAEPGSPFEMLESYSSVCSDVPAHNYQGVVLAFTPEGTTDWEMMLRMDTRFVFRKPRHRANGQRS